ncbi:MAG: LOG family protein [Planctomycetota bacterium]
MSQKDPPSRPAVPPDAAPSEPAGGGHSSPKHRSRRVGGLINGLKESIDQLENEAPTRGDLKIISRTLQELRHAFKVFGPYRRHRKVTVFGSARTQPHEPTYQQAVDFAKAMADRNWLVVTGAASGIMEAGHVGAGREHSMGLNILLPFEQTANSVIAGDHKLVFMKYFFTRKLMFVKECHAVVCLPGGFGTLDEALEILTLLQTGKRDMVPLVLLDEPGGTYWHELHEFIDTQLVQRRMIGPDDLSLYRITHDAQQCVDEIMQFYRVYHSMRYVHENLVLRVQHELPPTVLRDINRRYSDILVNGHFTLSKPLPEERNEPELKELPRLVFHFDRQSLGRLRQLIDHINREA